MSLFDFFFPEEAQASHLRSLAESNSLVLTQARLARARAEQTCLSAEKRVAELETEVGELTIVVEALLEILEEQGALSKVDLARKIGEIDARDGVIDGRMTKEKEKKKTPEKPQFRFPD